MANFFVRLRSPESDGRVDWYVCDEEGVQETGTCPAHELITATDLLTETHGKLETVLLLPDQDVLLLSVDVPGRSASRIRQAAPYAVEPFLTEDLDEVHIAFGEIKRGESALCMAINETQLESYLALFSQSSVSVRMATTLGALNFSEDIAFLEYEKSVGIRTQKELAAISEEAISSVLPQTLETVDPLESVLCVGSDEFKERLVCALQAGGFEEASISHETLEERIGRANRENGHLNLLQGNFSPVEESVSPARIANRSAIAICIALCAVSLLFWVQGLWAGFESQQLREQALDIYEEIYGTRDVAGNPVFRMQERMGTVTEESSAWLGILEHVSDGVSLIDMTNFDFNSASRKLTMTFTADSFAQFEQFRDSLESSQLSLDVNRVEQQENLVWARVTVSTQ